MKSSESIALNPPKETPLRLYFPDWSSADTVINRNEPWSVWLIGDQPLLYHWLDYAVNERYSHVIIHAVDRPSEVRKAMQKATLWPVRWEVVPSIPHDGQDVIEVLGLPWENNVETGDGAKPKGWELIDHWFRMEKSWFNVSFDNADIPDVNLAIGRNCNIHPTTKLNMPVFIGNNVQIAEGCEIGPYASIGSDCMLSGYNSVQHSKIEPRTFLGQHTELNGCYLEGGLLANLRHRALVPKVESFVADSWSRGAASASIGERLFALLIWCAFALRCLLPGNRGKRRTLATFQGMIMHTYADAPLWRQRMPWLLEVVAGRCRLFGVLPRTRSQFSSLTTDWQDILATAPVGVFSYADSHGCHSPDDDLEPVHAVFQATRQDAELGAVCRRFAWNLLLGKQT